MQIYLKLWSRARTRRYVTSEAEALPVVCFDIGIKGVQEKKSLVLLNFEQGLKW